MHLRCEPYCNCSLQPLWGDYHLGRSCRARSESEYEKEDGKIQDQCDKPPDTILYKGMNGARGGLEFILRKVNWRTRIETGKYKVCNSLFQMGDMGYVVMVDVDDESEDNSDGAGATGGLMEKPVRALRKSLHCDEMNVDAVDETKKVEFLHEEKKIIPSMPHSSEASR